MRDYCKRRKCVCVCCMRIFQKCSKMHHSVSVLPRNCSSILCIIIQKSYHLSIKTLKLASDNASNTINSLSTHFLVSYFKLYSVYLRIDRTVLQILTVWNLHAEQHLAPATSPCDSHWQTLMNLMFLKKVIDGMTLISQQWCIWEQILFHMRNKWIDKVKLLWVCQSIMDKQVEFLILKKILDAKD